MSETMENRLRQVRKELRLTQEALAQKLGIGKSALSMIETRKAALSKRNMNILVQEFNVNQEWLKTGKGNMFDAPPPEYFSTGGKMEKLNMMPVQDVPLYNMENTYGLASLFSGQSGQKPVGYVRIPGITKCDGAIYMTGEGMYPLIKSGDIVLYKQMSDTADIFWGDMYLLSISIDDEEYMMVKYIHRSERPGYVKLVSQSPSHDDKDVEVSKIRALAFIRATIRMNQIG